MEIVLYITHKNVPKIRDVDASFLDLMLVTTTTQKETYVSRTKNKKNTNQLMLFA